jgi:hypothetical protein
MDFTRSRRKTPERVFLFKASMDVYEQAGVISAGEPSAGDPVTAAEMAAISPDHLEKLGMQLAARRDKWVEARVASGVERRWIEDLDQYVGRDAATRSAEMMDTVAAGGPVKTQQAQVQRSTVFVNITRPKTLAAESRLANMLFPTDDRNWGIKPTPDPTLVAAAKKEAAAQVTQAAQPQQPQTNPRPRCRRRTRWRNLARCNPR